MVDRFSRRDPVRPARGLAQQSCLGGDRVPAYASPSKDARELLHRLQALDFSLYDTVLYLDAYPDSADALAYYDKLLAERAALLRALSADHGVPVTAFENAGKSWDWVNAPWPWEASAN